MEETPYEIIKENISKILKEDLLEFLPNKWEKIGDVLILTISEKIKNYQYLIAEEYANVLDCKTVLKNQGSIKGELRLPEMKIIFGSTNTETIHKENGIKYKLDPMKVMFSSGNMSERIRMSEIKIKNETIVDLFAGIGYFSLPMAVYGEPAKIFACEKNPDAFNYLCQNISINNVTEKIITIKGDNRIAAPKNIADRVLMGYFGKTQQFIPIAIEALKNNSGVIHFHDLIPDEQMPDKKIEEIKKIVEIYDKNVELLKYNHVKSYAPGIGHYVLDIKLW